MEYKSFLGESVEWELKIDLVKDLQNYIYQILCKKGFKDIDPNNALYQYFNLQKKQVISKKRKIHKSKEFLCPLGYELILKQFEDKVLNGESLLPYMSKKYKNASYNDGLLNDWNIYHFHLSNTFEKDGMATRSDFQLFAYVTENDMYFIQVYRHNAPQLYCKRELIEIINSNWSELLEDFQLKGVCGLKESLSDEQYKKMRKANISMVVELEDNRVYGLIGGGYASDGSSLQAIRESNYWCNRMREIQKIIKTNINILSTVIEKMSMCKFTSYDINLLWIDNADEVTLCEINNHVIIQINIKDGYFRVCYPWEVFGFDVLFKRIA